MVVRCPNDAQTLDFLLVFEDHIRGYPLPDHLLVRSVLCASPRKHVIVHRLLHTWTDYKAGDEEVANDHGWCFRFGQPQPLLVHLAVRLAEQRAQADRVRAYEFVWVEGELLARLDD